MSLFGRAGVARTMLLTLFILTSNFPRPAHADGVSTTINNGQPVTGTLRGSGADTYSFKVTAGSSFVISVSEMGDHVHGFVPEIDLVAPGKNDGSGLGRPFHSFLEETNAAEGTWTVKVHRADKGENTIGSYALTLVQVPGTITAASGIAGGAMTSGAVNQGTNSHGEINVWTFNGVAGQTRTLTLAKTSGKGFFPEVHVFAPDGEFAGGFGCGLNCSNDIPIKKSGLYTVIALRNDGANTTGTYTLSVNENNQ